MKTGTCLAAHVLCGACSASVVEQSFEYLDAPVERITGADVPMPYAANLERLALPQVCIALQHGMVAIDGPVLCCCHHIFPGSRMQRLELHWDSGESCLALCIPLLHSQACTVLICFLA